MTTSSAGVNFIKEWEGWNGTYDDRNGSQRTTGLEMEQSDGGTTAENARIRLLVEYDIHVGRAIIHPEVRDKSGCPFPQTLSHTSLTTRERRQQPLGNRLHHRRQKTRRFFQAIENIGRGERI